MVGKLESSQLVSEEKDPSSSLNYLLVQSIKQSYILILVMVFMKVALISSVLDKLLSKRLAKIRHLSKQNQAPLRR
jgi:ABC-type thiamin/hydroxymethylpyrimidine transport system permease subunit